MRVFTRTNAIIGCAIALLAGQWAATLAPDLLWGLHHLAFSPGWIAVALPAAAAGVAVVWAFLGAWRFHGRLDRSSTRGALGAVLLAAGGACIAALPVRHALLGDGALLLGLVRSGEGALVEGARSVRVLAHVHRLLALLGAGDDPWITFRVVGAVCAAASLTATLWMARWLSGCATVRWLTVALMLFSSTSLMYFGYPEVYAPLVTLLTCCAVGFIRWGGRYVQWLWFSAAAALLGVIYHPLGIIVWPAILYAAAHQLRLFRAGLARRAVVGLVALALGLYGTRIYGEFSGLLVTNSSVEGYGLFAPAHLLDSLNVLLLGAPMQLVLVGATLAGAPAWLRWHPVTVALGVYTATALGVMVLIDPTLGALDWDFWTLFAVPIGALAAWLAARSMSRAMAARISLPVVAAALLHSGAWVWANADAARGTEMVERMVARDLHYTGERRAKLASRMVGAGQGAAAERQYELALQDGTGNALALYQLGIRYHRRGRFADADRLLRRFVETAPKGSDTRAALALIAFQEGKRDVAALLCATFLLRQGANATGVYAARFLERSCAEPDLRMVLAVARQVARGEGAAARARWEDFVSRQGETQVTQLFSRALAGQPGE